MKTENLLLTLFVIVIIAMIILAYNRKRKESIITNVVDNETVSYKLPTDVNPDVFGPKFWAAYTDLTSRIPCGTCRGFAEKFIMFFHDLVNLKLGKPLYNPENFAEMSQLITTINLKGNRWPEE